MDSGRIADDVIERFVDALLLRHSTAPLSALSPDGWLIDPPASLDTGERELLRAETSLELVVDDDRAAVVAAWARARASGMSQAVVHLLADPGTPVTMQFADVRRRHGCLLVIVLSDAEASVEMGIGQGTKLIPRYCQMRRSELSYVLDSDDAATAMLGWSAAELAGRRSIEFIHPEDHDHAIDNWLEMLGNPGRSFRWRGRYRTSDERWLWMEITNHNRLEDPNHRDVLTEMVNIDDEMAAHEELRASEELFRELTQALPVGVVQTDRHGGVVFFNDRLREILGVRTLASLDDWRARLFDEDVAAFDAALDEVATAGSPCELEIRLEPSVEVLGRVCQLNLRALRSANGDPNGAIICITDVTEAARLRDELQVRATFDALTGCHNRESILGQLAQMLSASLHDPTGVVFIDLDQFKPINDSHGHCVGDELLVEVAERLRACTRRGDVVGRMGGDEFVVLYPDVHDHDDLAALAARVQRTLCDEGAVLSSGIVAIQASIGATLAVTGTEAEAALARADEAMYRAKRSRQGHPEILR
ncbi:MAG: diguanylate cyclase [Acidimicrobiia bacterium]